MLAGTRNPTNTPRKKTNSRVSTVKDWLYCPCVSGLGQDKQRAAQQRVQRKGDAEL